MTGQRPDKERELWQTMLDSRFVRMLLFVRRVQMYEVQIVVNIWRVWGPLIRYGA